MEVDLKIGKLIFENIREGKEPYWGALLLAEFKNFQHPEPSEITELRIIIETKEEWRKARDQFSAIRNLSLANSDKERELYLILAEKIAKITYNQSRNPAPFDSDSGHWIYGLSQSLARSINGSDTIARVNGILNLFQKDYNDKNYFIQEAFKSGGNLIDRIFSSVDDEMLKLRAAFPENIQRKDIRLGNEKAEIQIDSKKLPVGSLEIQFDIFCLNSKTGYYSLVWDNELNLIDEFLVVNTNVK